MEVGQYDKIKKVKRDCQNNVEYLYARKLHRFVHETQVSHWNSNESVDGYSNKYHPYIFGMTAIAHCRCYRYVEYQNQRGKD